MQAPSIDHVVAFRDRVMSSGHVQIYFCDGSSMELELDPSMLAGQVVANICCDLDLKDTLVWQAERVEIFVVVFFSRVFSRVLFLFCMIAKLR